MSTDPVGAAAGAVLGINRVARYAWRPAWK
jgi:hypothetical protein